MPTKTTLDKSLENFPEEGLAELKELLTKYSALGKKGQEKKSTTKCVKWETMAKINNRFSPQVFHNSREIMSAVIGEIFSTIEYRGSHNIKSVIVEICEVLAEIESSPAVKKRLRQSAANIVLIDSREHLISAVTTLATGVSIRN